MDENKKDINKKVSEHFKLKEFPIKDDGRIIGHVEPHKLIPTILERLRYIHKARSINILSAGRTPKDHIRIYHFIKSFSQFLNCSFKVS